MKKLIALLTAMILMTSLGFSQGLFKENSLNKAIKLCKDISKKDIISSLESSSPKELTDAQYELVKTEVEQTVGNVLSTVLENYKTFSKKNSERNHKKTFKINLKKGPVKNQVAKKLSEYREWMRESSEEYEDVELDEEYIHSTTKDILTEYYIPTLCNGVEGYTNTWLETEEEEYINFLKTKTVHTKVNDEKMMVKMSAEYLDENKEEIIKFLLYLAENHKIKKEYGTGEVDIEVRNKQNLQYLETIRALFNSALSSGKTELKGDTKDEIFENLYLKIQRSIIKDIKYQIKTSTEFK